MRSADAGPGSAAGGLRADAGPGSVAEGPRADTGPGTAAGGLRADTGPDAAPELLLLRGVLDAAPARVCVVGRDFRYRYVNREFCAFARKTPEQIIGLTTRELVGEEVARQLDPFAYAALAGQSVVREGWIDYRINGRKYINWLFAPMRNAAGDVDGFVVLMRDQTELREQQEEVAHRTAMLQALLDSLADGVCITDAAGTLVLCNTGFRLLFDCDEGFARPGLGPVDFVRHRLARGILYPDESAEHDPAALAERHAGRLAAAGGELTETVRLRNRWLDVRRRRLPDGGVVNLYMDITARVEAEQARRAQREALREAQQMGSIASLLAGVAHELNNPLSVVAAQATLLEEEAAGTPFEARAGKVSAAARRCGRIVASLLASANRRAPRREPVALRDVVADATDLLSLRLQGAGVDLSVDLPRRLPRVLGDSDQLTHLLANLLSNAVAVLAGRAAPRLVRISAEVGEGAVLLRIADNGPGVPEAMRERIFDPFFTTRPGGGGTGIGLALCRTIAHDHGGQIAVEETPGGGATMLVRLPAEAAKRRGLA